MNCRKHVISRRKLIYFQVSSEILVAGFWYQAVALLKLKPGGRVSLHLKALDADFSSQFEHIIPGHDLWGDLRGGVSILGRH